LFDVNTTRRKAREGGLRIDVTIAQVVYPNLSWERLRILAIVDDTRSPTRHLYGYERSDMEKSIDRLMENQHPDRLRPLHKVRWYRVCD
ncbi:unnamed protein product, partial [marine sediment metagenome]